jgi:hypothetical protein
VEQLLAVQVIIQQVDLRLHIVAFGRVQDPVQEELESLNTWFRLDFGLDMRDRDTLKQRRRVRPEREPVWNISCGFGRIPVRGLVRFAPFVGCRIVSRGRLSPLQFPRHSGLVGKLFLADGWVVRLTDTWGGVPFAD